MSRFRKLSQTIWHCQYHIIWTPKYRYRILSGDLAQDVDNCIRGFSDRLDCEITELNVQADHVHVLAMVPPKVSISDYTWNHKRSHSHTNIEQVQTSETKTLLG